MKVRKHRVKRTFVRRRRAQANLQSSIELARGISPKTTMMLYVQAGGRCEFDNCNKYLLEHAPTGRPGNFGEQGHIYAFKKSGPRGNARGRPQKINDLSNLMLLCKECHHEIDFVHPELYPVDVLNQFKTDHEERIYDLTGLAKDRDTVPLVLRGRVAQRPMEISDDEMQRAVAPNALQLRNKIDIDLTQLPDVVNGHYWESGKSMIDEKLAHLPRPRQNRVLHLSVFAIAAIPLLIYLGSKLSDKVHIDLYQRHRNPESWKWHKGRGTSVYATTQTRAGPDGVALIINVSGRIPTNDVTAQDRDMTVYELNVVTPEASVLVLNTREDLDRFVAAYVAALERIRTGHPGIEVLDVFPAVPAPVAISIGRHTMPKVGPRLRVYDREHNSRQFLPVMTIT